MKILFDKDEKLKFVNVNLEEVCFELGVEREEEEDMEEAAMATPQNTANQPLPTDREGCKYMNNCYRSNPSHRREFSHPTDSDWNQGECPYGTTCYRRNPVHKSRFTHSQRRAAINAINRLKDDKSSNDEDDLDDYLEDES